MMHSPGCPGAGQATREVLRALDDLGLSRETMSVRTVRDEGEADACGMHGSPSVTVNGLDVDRRMWHAPTSLHG
jgi:hypothetical protein